MTTQSSRQACEQVAKALYLRLHTPNHHLHATDIAIIAGELFRFAQEQEAKVWRKAWEQLEGTRGLSVGHREAIRTLMISFDAQAKECEAQDREREKEG